MIATKQKMLPFFESVKLQSPEQAINVLNKDLDQDGIEDLFLLLAKQLGYISSEALVKGHPHESKTIIGDVHLYPVKRGGLQCKERDTLNVLMRVKTDEEEGED